MKIPAEHNQVILIYNLKFCHYFQKPIGVELRKFKKLLNFDLAATTDDKNLGIGKRK